MEWQGQYDLVIPTPAAWPVRALGMRIEAGALRVIDTIETVVQTGTATGATQDKEVQRQLRRYFADGRQRFTLPCEPAGTDFQRRVWRALCAIPPGEVITYGDLARQLGTGPRAIGAACRANPLPVVIPCHRVVAAGGMGGYAGATQGPAWELKRYLLAHEGARIAVGNRRSQGRGSKRGEGGRNAVV